MENIGLNPFGLQADCVASYLCNLRIVNLKGLRPDISGKDKIRSDSFNSQILQVM